MSSTSDTNFVLKSPSTSKKQYKIEVIAMYTFLAHSKANPKTYKCSDFNVFLMDSTVASAPALDITTVVPSFLLTTAKNYKNIIIF